MTEKALETEYMLNIGLRGVLIYKCGALPMSGPIDVDRGVQVHRDITNASQSLSGGGTSYYFDYILLSYCSFTCVIVWQGTIIVKYSESTKLPSIYNNSNSMLCSESWRAIGSVIAEGMLSKIISWPFYHNGRCRNQVCLQKK